MQCTQNVAFANHNDGGNNYYYWAICMYIRMSKLCVHAIRQCYYKSGRKNKEELTMIIISM